MSSLTSSSPSTTVQLPFEGTCAAHFGWPTMRERMVQKVMVLDGAMGTQIQTFNPTSEDFRGHEGCNDYLSLTRPDIITAIHERYLQAGCDCVETNTFGSNRIKLEEYGIESELREVNFASIACVKNAIQSITKIDAEKAKPRYILASLGPSGYLPSSSDPTLSNISPDRIYEVYREQSVVLIEAGVDAILIETGQDILEMKLAVIGAKDAIADCGRDVVLMAQPTLDTTGRMLLGTDIATAIPLFTDLGVDVFGLNCSTGPDEMRESVRTLSQYSPMPISIIPNAGMPENIDGVALYRLPPEDLAKTLEEYVVEFGVQFVGGCCGTSPEHIKAIATMVDNKAPKVRQIEPLQVVTSSIQSVDFNMDNKPILVGERLNSQGSRKFKNLLLADDYETMGLMAREMVDSGSHLLDLCVAVNERDDEKEQMCRLVHDLSHLVEAPLVIDSTEPEVIEAALKMLPGRGIVNSIHLEGNGERLHKVAPLLKKYGGSAVAMLIDENGMAKTAAQKHAVAQKLYDAVTKDYGLPPHTLIFDALTFTLATGDDEFKRSAIETFEGIRWIKQNLPGTYTILGVSNASFGLSPAARRVLNSVYLYHAVQAGLDFAIVNAKEIIPYPMLSEEEKAVSNALIFDEKESALADFIAYFESNQATTAQVEEDDGVERTVEEQLHYQILNRKKDGVEAVLDEALKKYTAPEIINAVLLPAMKEVGDKMATGELILPFVLQSAEVMKKSVSYLEQFLDKNDSVSKGKLVLATVYGDVHDIGKNLVKTIFSNNGYEVYDLGKQVPLATILDKAKEVGADAIGLSALLVTTSKQMAYCVEECHKSDLNYPIIIGGAAINRDYGFRISCLKNSESGMQEEELVYPGGVFYSKDAFEGLSIMNRLQDPTEKEKLLGEYQADIVDRRQRAVKYQAIKDEKAAAAITESQVPDAKVIPAPPFWGMKRVDAQEIDIDEVLTMVDFPSLFRLSWGLKNMAKDEYEKMLKTQYYPLVKEIMAESKKHGIFQPQVLYGYLPCYRDGNTLIVLDESDMKTERERFEFPRQIENEYLCLADYFAAKDSGKIDVIPFQLVTMGDNVSAFCNALDKKNEYSRSYYIHGLAVQMADALAEWTHRRIKAELGMQPEQGKRYSFGYPACPDLADQVKQFKLMRVSEHTTIQLTDAYQIIPEQSTSALVVHHSAAKYYSV